MIDPRQRYEDPEQALRLALGAFQAALWTALPGIVKAYRTAPAPTVDVQLAIGGAFALKDGTTQATAYPLLKYLPVVFPRGGHCTFTFPVAAGDECLVIFASRAIDAWWQNGAASGPQRPVESRMHDIQDGFALIGPFSQVTKLANVSSATAQLRSNDGEAYVELDPSGHIVNIVGPGGVNITGPVAISGAVTVSQTIAAQSTISSSVDVQAAGISLKNHVHPGVASGSSNTGTPQG